jgi:quercetin dioxygenase-like cupin family protein
MSARDPGITAAGTGVDDTVWNILGQTYYLKSNTPSSFSFETLFPPGTFVPPHIHPEQDEFIYMLDGTFDLFLAGEEIKASTGDLIRMPMGLPHGIFNNSQSAVKAFFWVSPSGDLQTLFERIDNVADPEEVVRIASEHGVEFLPPPGA